jgi:riboflavin kinase/FMN adenylyltransferase
MLTLQLGDPLPFSGGSSRYIAAIGNFDGVHLGHSYLLQQVAAAARRQSLLSLAITFWPNPRAVLQPAGWPGYLTTFDERSRLLAALQLDAQMTIPFSESFAGLAPAEFVGQLAGAMPLAELWVGEDFRFGHRRSGDVAVLRELAAAHGIVIRVVERRAGPAAASSSSTIRDQVRAGQVEQAAELLGRPYSLGGTVVAGDRRGRQLGFPTANLAPDDGKLVPGRGIYATVARCGELARPAAVSIGIRPQFGGQVESVEAYLLEFTGDLYGQRLELEFQTKLRDEQRFASVDSLIAQIGRDVARVRDTIRLTGSAGPT